MRKTIVLMLLAVLCGAIWMRAQDAPFTFRVDVGLVSVDAGVSDAAGRSVTTLTRDDFQIYEDGVLQQIQNFSSVDTPYSLLMLLDCSNSTHDQWLFLSAAIKRFIAGLRPQDRLSLAAFGSTIHLFQEWHSPLQSAVDPITPPAICEGTDFYGAIDWASAYLKSQPGRRGAIVLTDGLHRFMPRKIVILEKGANKRRIVDAAEDPSFQATLRTASGIGAPFYFIAVNTDINPGPDFSPLQIYDRQQVRARMERLADLTGGRIVFPKQPLDVIPTFEQIGRELGTSYSFGYAPTNVVPGRHHRIEIRVRDKSLRVQQSRDGYDIP